MGPHITENLLYGQGHNHSDKLACYERTKFFINYAVDRGLISHTYKQLKKDIKKSSNSI